MMVDVYVKVRQLRPVPDSDDSFTIGQMCADFDVTARALRFYEDEQLLAPESRGTQRLYSPRDRARLAWILRGRRVGLSLADIKELLDLYDLGDDRRTQRLKTIERCSEQVAKLKQQRVDIDATIAELETFIGMVRHLTDTSPTQTVRKAQGAR